WDQGFVAVALLAEAAAAAGLDAYDPWLCDTRLEPNLKCWRQPDGRDQIGLPVRAAAPRAVGHQHAGRPQVRLNAAGDVGAIAVLGHVTLTKRGLGRFGAWRAGIIDAPAAQQRDRVVDARL